jgi:NTP pyrophosphatase (non-canonical NTP hydrolase)
MESFVTIGNTISIMYGMDQTRSGYSFTSFSPGNQTYGITVSAPIIGANTIESYTPKPEVLEVQKLSPIKEKESIDSKNYVEECLRTESVITKEIISRISNPKTLRLLHAAMGMSTEAAELVDMLKKHIFYGKKIDFPNAIEELGDAMWYIGIGVDVLQTTLDEIMSVNIEKLRSRYPEKFTEHNAINRDLKTERKILER